MKTGVTCCGAVLALLISAQIAMAGEPPGIPEKALQAMSCYVGKWEGETIQDGENLGPGGHEGRWAAGKYCITLVATGKPGQAEPTGIGMCGWDAKSQDLVEHWFGPQGIYVTARYPLGGIGEDVWEGSYTVIFGNGQETCGKCERRKTDDGFVWTGRSVAEGKESVRKTTCHRVTTK